VRECYEDTARRAERETLSYEQYLLEVISRECEQRRKSQVQRLLKDSALPPEKSLQNFNLKRLPAKAARQFRTLLAERYERGSVLMTSNLAFSKWESIFKDAMMTAAAIDRLVHHSVIIELNIPSYRVEEAMKNQRADSRGRMTVAMAVARKKRERRGLRK
jgi:DNA replication protein DnaC